MNQLTIKTSNDPAVESYFEPTANNGKFHQQPLTGEWLLEQGIETLVLISMSLACLACIFYIGNLINSMAGLIR